MKNQPTLETVAAAFKQWRETRQHFSVKTPAVLREQAIALLQSYPAKQVKGTLGLSATTLSAWRQQTSEQPTSPPFVALPRLTQLTPAPVPLHITLQNSQGVQLTITGTPTPEQLIALVQGLQCHAGDAP